MKNPTQSWIGAVHRGKFRGNPEWGPFCPIQFPYPRSKPRGMGSIWQAYGNSTRVLGLQKIPQTQYGAKKTARGVPPRGFPFYS